MVKVKAARLIWERNWKKLSSLFPHGWREMAFQSGAISYNRSFTPDTLLHVLLLYLTGSASLREAAVDAHLTGLITITPVGLYYRLRKSTEWLRWLAEGLMQQLLAHQSQPAAIRGRRLQIVDATTIQPPGSKGTGWRLHYVLLFPSLLCSKFVVSTSKVGESFEHVDVEPDDIVMGDRGYATRKGVAYVVCKGGDVVVRMNRTNLPVQDDNGKQIEVLSRLEGLEEGQCRAFPAWVKHKSQLIQGRVVALRLSPEAEQKAKKRAVKQSRKKGHTPNPKTPEAQKYVILYTTLSASEFSAEEVMSLYPYRWQDELVFKRFKSLLGIGQLPIKKEEVARAWIYGKLLAAFLLVALEDEQGPFPPRGGK